MPEIAAAAALGIRTEPGAAVRRGREDTLDAAIGRVPADVRDAQVVFLVRRGVRHEDGAAVHPADAEALAREAGDDGTVNFVLFQHTIPLFRIAEWAGRVPTALCRGGDSRARRNAADSHRLSIKTYKPIASVAALSERLAGRSFGGTPPSAHANVAAVSDRPVRGNSTARGH